MSIEDNKNLLLYARSLWKKHNKFIPFPYVISNEKDILKKSEDVIPCLLNKEAFEINLYLLKRYIKEYPQKQLFRLWGDGVNIGGLNKVLSLSSEEKSGVLISKEGMRRADKFLHLSALVIHKYLTNYDYYLFREGADEIGGIIICENFIDCKDIVKGINNQIYKYSQMLQLSSVPHTKYPNRYGSMFVCACNPITKNFQREKNIEDTVKVYCSQYINVHKDKENILCSGSRIWKSEVELDGNHPSSEVVEKNRFLQKQENIQRYKSYNMNPWQAMYSFNLSFKKQQKTLFDENFIGFGLEDWEFSYRLVKKMGYIPKLKPSIKTIQYDDFHNTRNPFKNINQQDIKCYIKNALYFIEKYPEDKNLHKEIVKFLKKFEYCPKTHKFKRLFVDFQKLDEENIHDTINKYRLITAYKSRL